MWISIGDISSILIGPQLQDVEIFSVCYVLLGQLSYARKKKIKARPTHRGISCLLLVLYDIRISGFHARKESIWCANNRQ